MAEQDDLTHEQLVERSKATHQTLINLTNEIKELRERIELGIDIQLQEIKGVVEHHIEQIKKLEERLDAIEKDRPSKHFREDLTLKLNQLENTDDMLCKEIKALEAKCDLIQGKFDDFIPEHTHHRIKERLDALEAQLKEVIEKHNAFNIPEAIGNVAMNEVKLEKVLRSYLEKQKEEGEWNKEYMSFLNGLLSSLDPKEPKAAEPFCDNYVNGLCTDKDENCDYCIVIHKCEKTMNDIKAEPTDSEKAIQACLFCKKRFIGLGDFCSQSCKEVWYLIKNGVVIKRTDVEKNFVPKSEHLEQMAKLYDASNEAVDDVKKSINEAIEQREIEIAQQLRDMLRRNGTLRISEAEPFYPLYNELYKFITDELEEGK